MAGLANLLEDFRNYIGKKEWDIGRDKDAMSGYDPALVEFVDKFGLGTDGGGMIGSIEHLRPPPRTAGRMGVIEDWLKDVLGQGGMSPQELWDRGRMVGFTEPEVHAARLNLLGTNRPDGNGGYIVELPRGLSGMTR